MKFSVTYGRKVPAGRKYEMLEVSVTEESDTKRETKQQLYNRLEAFVDKNITAAQAMLMAKSGDRNK